MNTHDVQTPLSVLLPKNSDIICPQATGHKISQQTVQWFHLRRSA